MIRNHFRQEEVAELVEERAFHRGPILDRHEFVLGEVLVFQRAPFVDFVVGPGQLQAVPELIEKAISNVLTEMWREWEAARAKADAQKKALDDLPDDLLMVTSWTKKISISIGY